MGFVNYNDFKEAHTKWVSSALETDKNSRQNKWTESIAVGSELFVEKIKEALRFRAKGRKIICADDAFELREEPAPYGKANSLEFVNTFSWDVGNSHP